MYNLLRTTIAFTILTTVATAQSFRTTTVESEVQFPGEIICSMKAAGSNGNIKGKGQMKLFRSAVYPMTIENSTFGYLAIFYRGTIKRQGVLYPYVMTVTRQTGVAELIISAPPGLPVINTLDGLAVNKVRQ